MLVASSGPLLCTVTLKTAVAPSASTLELTVLLMLMSAVFGLTTSRRQAAVIAVVGVALDSAGEVGTVGDAAAFGAAIDRRRDVRLALVSASSAPTVQNPLASS